MLGEQGKHTWNKQQQSPATQKAKTTLATSKSGGKVQHQQRLLKMTNIKKVKLWHTE